MDPVKFIIHPDPDGEVSGSQLARNYGLRATEYHIFDVENSVEKLLTEEEINSYTHLYVRDDYEAWKKENNRLPKPTKMIRPDKVIP